MATKNSAELLAELKQDALDLLAEISSIEKSFTAENLRLPGQRGGWNTLQVLEHLSSYYRFYVPLIEKRLAASKAGAAAEFRSGWLGGYFTKMMLPKEGMVTNKMKAMKNHSPAPDLDAQQVLEEFQRWQRHWVLLIDRAGSSNLNAVRIPLSIAPWLTLKLGDVLQFISAHNHRHRVQIRGILGV